MKAVSLTNAGRVEIVTIPEPRPSFGELVLQVQMVGLCGTDLNSYRGNNPLVTYPRVLGHEIAAVVVEGTAQTPAGTLVTVSPYTSCGFCASCRAGRFNACRRNETFGVQRDGALTELLCVPESKVYPSKLTVRERALVEPLTVGAHAVARGQVTSNDTVAIFGCGGVGLGAVASSAFRGARTIAIDLDDAKLETARSAGATDLIHTGREDVRTRLRELTDDGPSVIIEAIGLPETFRAAVEEVSFAGRVVYIGYAREPVAYETKLFVQKELDIRGSRNALSQDFHEVIGMLQAKRFPVERAITAVVDMDEVPAMLRKWSDAPSLFTKIMVHVHQ